MQDILPEDLNGARLSGHNVHNPLIMALTHLGFVVIYTVLEKIIKNGQNMTAVCATQ